MSRANAAEGEYVPSDLITTPTTSVGDLREPVFVHAEQESAGLARLDDYVASNGRRPNILVILMDDVGWGDFGCYGGGAALGAPTPNIDRLAAGGVRLTSCYSEPTCTPSRASLMTGRLPSRHGLQRPPMYGETGGLHDEVTVAELLSDAGYVTQCVGKWHLGENRESQPQHVGFDDFYGFLSVSDMYSEWRDPHYFPEIVSSGARTEWVRNLPFNRCFVHATRGGDVEEVEEVDIPCLSTLDDKWTRYSEEFIARMASGDAPWFLYHNTRGAHFDNYPSERWLGASAAKHPFRDTILELDDVVGRLVAALEDSGQLEHTMIVLSSDNGPHMENWPDAGYTPFRSAKGSTWEGGVRVPGIVSWPGMIEPGQVSDGLFAFTDLLPTALRLAGVRDAVPSDRFIDGVDQTSFLLTAGGASNRKFHYYWLLSNLAAVRAGEYKFTMRSTSDGATDAAGPGGFTGVDQHYTYPRLHNLYLDPKEERSYLTRKLAYVDVFGTAVRNHFHTYRAQPTNRVGRT